MSPGRSEKRRSTISAPDSLARARTSFAVAISTPSPFALGNRTRVEGAATREAVRAVNSWLRPLYAVLGFPPADCQVSEPPDSPDAAFMRYELQERVVVGVVDAREKNSQRWPFNLARTIYDTTWSIRCMVRSKTDLEAEC